MDGKIFVEGMCLKVRPTHYGEIIKIGCKVDTLVEFLQGFKNERGFVNIDILKNRDGKPYAVVNTYNSEPAADDNIVDFGDVDTDEVPF